MSGFFTRSMIVRASLVAFFLAGSAALTVSAKPRADRAVVRVLFLGDEGHHRPRERFQQLQPVLVGRGVEMVYTEDLALLSAEKLQDFQALVVFANIEVLPPAAEAALVDYVRGGGGLVPIHCASFCFQNSPAWVAMVGAQFQKHGTGEFRTVILRPEHPVMKGFSGFSSWDETYVHTRHNEVGRTVLEERVEGTHREPWTWVRAEGRGRVFYTAWGHDQRTWGHPGFHNLVERGIRFAAGGDPQDAGVYVDHPVMTTIASDLPPFEYQPAKVPFYDPEARGWGSQKEPLGTMQKPLGPEASRQHLVMPEGFRVELFATEPMLAAKPLAITFDADGSLYVAESVDYPNDLALPKKDRLTASAGGHDRIVRLLDTDGDGQADTRKVFAAGLSIPTSMLPHDGGLIVAQAPHMLYLKDLTGDGRADLRKVLFTGWGTGDTHSGPSNLTWGLDGWVYATVGYSGFNGEVGGQRHRFGQGFLRFRPDGSALEFLRSTNNNTWGFGLSEEGLVFGSTANGNPSEYLPLPNRVYERVRGWTAARLEGIAGSPRMELAVRPDGTKAAIRQVDHHGQFTAAAGHRLYTARAFPPEYWNRTAFVCEPTGHLVATFELSPKGAGFRSRMAWDLLASDDEWTAPIAAEVGPDGSVWVVDWYNFIVQHNPTPAGFENGRGNAYVTPLRDKTHGRIWRVVHDSAPEAYPVARKPQGVAGLVEMLRDTNQFWRQRAQRTLVDQCGDDPREAKKVLPLLISLVDDQFIDAVGLNPAAIHALWLLAELGFLEGESADANALTAAVSALKHPSAGVRLNAVKVLPRTDATWKAVAEAGLMSDASPLVRLAVLEAASESGHCPALRGVLTAMLRDPQTLQDPLLADAATAAAAVHAPVAMPVLVASAFTDLPAATKRLQLIDRVAEHVSRGATDDRQVAAAAVGGLLQQLAAAEDSAEVTVAVLAGLARGWPKQVAAEFSSETVDAIDTLVERLSPEGQGLLVGLIQRAGSNALAGRIASIQRSLLKVVDDTEQADEKRTEAATQLILLSVDDADAASGLIERIGGRSSPAVSLGLLAAVGRSTAAETAAGIIEKMPSLTPSLRQAAVRTLLDNRGWAEVLIQALEDGRVRLDDLPVAERARLAEHPDESIRERSKVILSASGGLPNPDRQRVIDELLPVVLAGGDAEQGRAVFRKHCSTCHHHSGEGGRVGPELTGMAVHPPAELLIHILDPNRSVEGNFRAYTVVTDEGLVVNGLLASESRTAVDLIDAEGKRRTIQRDAIDEFLPSPNSLMPVGFEKQIQPAEFADLLAFLTKRGQYTPLPLAKAATVVSTQGMFYDPANTSESLVFEDWGPKRFAGVPFNLIDPQGGNVPNAVMLHSPNGLLPPQMPKQVSVTLGVPVKKVHLLGGVAGWGFPASPAGTTSMIVRLRYADGVTEDFPLVNGQHIADYVRRIDVPESEFAFELRQGRQLRYIQLVPRRKGPVSSIEFVKGDDGTSPIVMAVTLE